MISYHLLITYGVHLYSWLEGRLLNIEEFDIRTTINKLDRFLITKNIASRINVDHNKPMDGIHFNKNFGLVWFYRKTEPAGYDKEPHTTYTIYSIYKCNIEQIRSFLETNNINDIIIEVQKKPVTKSTDLNNIVNQIFKKGEKTLLITVINKENQRRYLGVKIN